MSKEFDFFGQKIRLSENDALRVAENAIIKEAQVRKNSIEKERKNIETESKDTVKLLQDTMQLNAKLKNQLHSAKEMLEKSD